MRFEDEHRFDAPAGAVADLLVDPAFHQGIALPDLELLDVVDHRDDGRDGLLSLRYEYVGSLDPRARRLLGGRRLTWVQELALDRDTGAGRLAFAAEASPKRLHGRAGFTLLAEDGDTVWALRGEVRVGVPLVGPSAEGGIVAGVLQRLAIVAGRLREHLRTGG